MLTEFISDWKRFETFRNCNLFCTFLLLRYFNSGDAHHANHGKHSLDHYLQHCAHIVYQIYSVLKLFKITVCFTHFGFYEISTMVMRIMLTMANLVLIIISNIAHSVYIRLKAFWNFSKLLFVLQIFAFTKFLLWWLAPWKLWWTLFKSSFPTLDTLCRLDLQCFQTFRNCSLFCAFWLIRNIYSGDAHDANYCKHSLNHHFQYWTHSVYQIESVLKLFEIAVCFAHFGFYEISTPVMHIMLTMANIV